MKGSVGRGWFEEKYFAVHELPLRLNKYLIAL